MKTTIIQSLPAAATVLLALAAGVPSVNAVSPGVSASDPLFFTWKKNTTGQPAFVRLTTGGVPTAEWSAVDAPPGAYNPLIAGAEADISAIHYTSSDIYLTASGLASYVMGPWYRSGSRSGYFEYRPIDRFTAEGLPYNSTGVVTTLPIFRIPRTPTPTPPGVYPTLLGPIGLWVNGTAVFGPLDGHSWGNSTSNIVGNLGVWNTDAYVQEGETFDHAGFHQPGPGDVWGQHHAHINPVALRWQLGDHILASVDERGEPLYQALPAGGRHSPILGWAADGYPIYGPFGFSNPASTSSVVRLMRSGYVLRDGSMGSRNLASTGRDKLPRWAMVVQGRIAPMTPIVPDEYGPAVTAEYPLGTFVEDWDYRGDLAGGGTFTVDWDLDQCNARWCVTPEYPSGTYAYFVTVDETRPNCPPKFPYVIGPMFRGVPTGVETGSIPSPNTRYF